MPACPDHARALVANAQGQRGCPVCRGLFLTQPQLETFTPGASERLTLETREDALPFKRIRDCPDCGTPMAPWRIGQLEAWLEKCGTCDGHWVEQSDVPVLRRTSKQAAVSRAWSSFDARERATIAKDLAGAVPRDETAPGGGETLLATLGVPVLSKLGGAHPTRVTYLLMLGVVGAFLARFIDPLAFSFEALAYEAGSGFTGRLLTSAFAHEGWGHFLGNLVFLWVYGDAVERKVGAAKTLGFFMVVAVASVALDAQFADAGAIIGGASGALYGLIGLAAVLQAGARVTLGVLSRMGLRGLRVPLWLGVFAQVAVQFAFPSTGHVAVIAHVSGLVAGLATGVGLRLVWRAQERRVNAHV